VGLLKGVQRRKLTGADHQQALWGVTIKQGCQRLLGRAGGNAGVHLKSSV
jgi:hypothetical protein